MANSIDMKSIDTRIKNLEKNFEKVNGIKNEMKEFFNLRFEKIKKDQEKIQESSSSKIENAFEKLSNSLTSIEGRINAIEVELLENPNGSGGGDSSINERISRIEKLMKSSEKVDNMKNEIDEIKKIEQEIEPNLKKAKEEGILEKLIPSMKNDSKGFDDSKIKEVQEKIEKSDGSPETIGAILSEYIQSAYNLEKKPTYSKIITFIESVENLSNEIKKQIREFFDKLIKKEYGEQKVAFSSNLKPWAEEIIKLIEEENSLKINKK